MIDRPNAEGKFPNARNPFSVMLIVSRETNSTNGRRHVVERSTPGRKVFQ
jgi:hypothetical protein